MRDRFRKKKNMIDVLVIDNDQVIDLKIMEVVNEIVLIKERDK